MEIATREGSTSQRETHSRNSVAPSQRKTRRLRKARSLRYLPLSPGIGAVSQGTERLGLLILGEAVDVFAACWRLGGRGRKPYRLIAHTSRLHRRENPAPCRGGQVPAGAVRELPLPARGVERVQGRRAA